MGRKEEIQKESIKTEKGGGGGGTRRGLSGTSYCKAHRKNTRGSKSASAQFTLALPDGGFKGTAISAIQFISLKKDSILSITNEKIQTSLDC